MKITNEKEFTQGLVKVIQDEIQRWKTERILLIFLDKNGNIFFKKIISEGYYKYSAYFYPDTVEALFETAKPHACIWSHNHVNNNMEPSNNDDDVHHWLMELCKKHNVICYDSIIVMKNYDDYYSYREHNRLDVIPKKKNNSHGGY